MRPYKHIERCIARYIATRYRRVVEIGVGANFEAARALRGRGCSVWCMDLHPGPAPDGIEARTDDLYHPRCEWYRGAELLYSIRPGVEMVPALRELARTVDADLLVYHPGDELYGRGGQVIDCGVPLHRYHIRSIR